MEKVQINGLSFHLKKLEKEEQVKPIISRRREINNIRVEINEWENRKTIEKINYTSSQTDEEKMTITK